MKTKAACVLGMLFWTTAAFAETSHVLPEGAEIKVRTDTSIPAKPAPNSKYSATVSDNVVDKSGAIAIPRDARAQLVAVPAPNGKDTNLDLRSVTVNAEDTC